MAKAKAGDTVNVHYTGRLEDGTVFDSSESREPLEFTIGEGQVIPGFENAVVGLEPGESREVTIPADQAYGEHRDELVIKVPRSQVPPEVTPEVGQQLFLQQPNGQGVPVTISEVTDDAITLDANPPLAGKTLIFNIKLVDIAA
ncbi:MAG TPA: peptidylprolyl isomerase [Armatimonadota bacterium]|nr:peptidylprolyl isomerase [Armatimonadota bacterium]